MAVALPDTIFISKVKGRRRGYRFEQEGTEIAEMYFKEILCFLRYLLLKEFLFPK
jgi:hypothetical protein